ncbi:unnamed protein product, partial [Prorocentrum cordatum]
RAGAPRPPPAPAPGRVQRRLPRMDAMAPSRAPPAKDGDERGIDSRAGSTCAASMPSCHSERDLGPRLSPLLRASPPAPVGRVAGRFRVRLWRASRSQPFGVAFADGAAPGRAAVAEDAPHLGLRAGDEAIGRAAPPDTASDGAAAGDAVDDAAVDGVCTSSKHS